MKTSRIALIPLVFILSLMMSCSADNASITQISPKESAGLVANEFAVIIDVRTVGEWQNKHIEGAIFIPINELKGRMSELKQYQDKQLIMQCAVGGRSSKAVKLLQQAGFSNAVNMNGGIVAWEKAGLPLK